MTVAVSSGLASPLLFPGILLWILLRVHNTNGFRTQLSVPLVLLDLMLTGVPKVAEDPSCIQEAPARYSSLFNSPCLELSCLTTNNVIDSMILLAFMVSTQYCSQGSSVIAKLQTNWLSDWWTCPMKPWSAGSNGWAMVPTLGVVLITRLLLSNWLRLLDNTAHFMCWVSFHLKLVSSSCCSVWRERIKTQF